MEAGLYKSMVFVRGLIAGLQRQGIEGEALFRGTSLEGRPLGDSNARITLEEWRTLTRRAIALSGDRGLGLSIGGNASDHMLQIVTQLAVACGTLREAMRMVERYRVLLGNTLQFDLIEEGDLAYFVCAPLLPDQLLPEFDPELVLSLVYRVARRFARLDTDDAKELWLAYPAPAHAARYAEVFQCPVRFDRPRNAILLARSFLDQPQPYADTRMLDVLRDAAERMLVDQRTPSLPDQVRALLRNESDLRKIDAGRVARMLRLHPRTFRRQLIAAKAPWSAILDETRRRIACEELRRHDVSIREVADRLGFSEPSAFTRAFKRWTGKTPAKYNRALSGR
jgi:AraC-like DNA-binding protein